MQKTLKMENSTIRNEIESDATAVRHVNLAAFETPEEADLVDALRNSAEGFFSQVAEQDGEIVGNIVFSPVELVGFADAKIIALGPMAVLPTYQNQQIGTALVTAGIERCRTLGFGAIVVVGHPEFFPRFGFVPAENYQLTPEWELPPGVFMALPLDPEYLTGKSGLIKYQPVFSGG